VPARSQLQLEIAAWGGAAAWRLRDDLSVGATLSWQRFELDSLTQRFDRQEQPTGDPHVDGLTGGFFGPADFLPENRLNEQVLRGEDEDLAGSVGVLWRPLSALSVGAVYRRAGDFDFEARYVHGPRAALRGLEPGTVEPSVGGDGIFHAPDSFGAGVAWRPRDDLVVAFDWDRVEYSSLSDDLVNLLLAARGDVRSFTIADVDELHLGAEYQAVTWRLPVSFRLGMWHDPDHRLRYGGVDPVLRARFAPGEDQLHFSGGLGIVVGHAQMDLAFDASKLVDTVSLSTVARF
jgi:long-subunit fatty acid transport protein